MLLCTFIYQSFYILNILVHYLANHEVYLSTEGHLQGLECVHAATQSWSRHFHLLGLGDFQSFWRTFCNTGKIKAFPHHLCWKRSWATQRSELFPVLFCHLVAAHRNKPNSPKRLLSGEVDQSSSCIKISWLHLRRFFAIRLWGKRINLSQLAVPYIPLPSLLFISLSVAWQLITL